MEKESFDSFFKSIHRLWGPEVVREVQSTDGALSPIVLSRVLGGCRRGSWPDRVLAEVCGVRSLVR